MEKRTKLTLCLAVRDGQVLLGMKKRGFGSGRYNGFGGKLMEGETVEDAAKREMREECGVEATALTRVGIHDFEFAHDLGNILEVHVYRVDDFSGEPSESEEMRPEWFPVDAIPFDTMWPDDRFWIPLFLQGKLFRTRFLFGEGDRVLKQDIREVASLEKEA